MRFDKLTLKLQEAVQKAQALCEKERHQAMEAEHLAFTLLEDQDSIAHVLLNKTGIEVSRIKEELSSGIAKFPCLESSNFQVYLSETFKKNMDDAFNAAQQLHDEFVSAEHIILGALEDKNNRVGKIITSHGLTAEKVLQALTEIR